jgi:WD40 repeat protein
MATGSDDKTVRVWSLPEGRLLRTLRVPIGPGDGGKIYATTVSPDGRWVVAGGYDPQADINSQDYIYVFDAATGAMITTVGPVNDVIMHMAFSQDGRWLALTGATRVGLKVIDTRSWRIVAEDKTYAGNSYGATFGPDGHLYTVSYDHKVRQYGVGPDFKKLNEVATKEGKEPFSIAVDHRGQLVAVAYAHARSVDVFDAATLKYRFAADLAGVDNGDLSAVVWSSDSTHFLAGGQYEVKYQDGWKMPLLIFDRNGKKTASAPVSHSTVFDLQPCGNAIAMAAADPGFGLVDDNAQVSVWKSGVAPDVRDDQNFTIAPDAKQIRFGLSVSAGEQVLFDLGQSTLTTAADTAPANFIAPVTEGLPVAKWQNDYHPTFAGKPIELEDYETARSLAIRPDKTGFVLGTDFWIRAYDAQGKMLWRRAGPGIAWGVNLSADGRILVVAYADGTIRWFNAGNGNELLALFVNTKAKTWVAWTPSGYYMAAPGGEDLIGWHVNRGWKQAADFFPASKFHDKFARADIVERVLTTLDEAQAIRQADQARPQKVEAQAQAPIIESLPPVLSILSPDDEARIDSDKVRVDYLLRSPSGTPIDSVEALINGTPAGNRGTGDDSAVKKCVSETHGLGRTTGALQGCRGSLTVTLPAGTSQIGIFAKTSSKSSDVAEVRVTRSAAMAAIAPVVAKPKLYALVAGISNYDDPTYKLAFAAKDAHDFAGSLANQNGALYSEVDIKLLVDAQASAVNIKDGLDWLAHQVTDRDVGIIYLAGHGLVDERNHFYFLAADSDAKRLRATAVAKDDIAETLDGLAGKAILFLDACHSGSMFGSGRRAIYDNNEVVNDFLHSERGVVVFASSTGRQVSIEDPSWGNGAFTKALVEGLGSPGTPALAKIAGYDTITPAMLEV